MGINGILKGNHVLLDKSSQPSGWIVLQLIFWKTWVIIGCCITIVQQKNIWHPKNPSTNDFFGVLEFSLQQVIKGTSHPRWFGYTFHKLTWTPQKNDAFVSNGFISFCSHDTFRYNASFSGGIYIFQTNFPNPFRFKNIVSLHFVKITSPAISVQ